MKVLRGIEGRSEINQVNGFVLDVTLEDIEVGAVVKRTHAAIVRRKSGNVNFRLHQDSGATSCVHLVSTPHL